MSPAWLAKLNRFTERLRDALPMQPMLANLQTPRLPFFTPSHPIAEHRDGCADSMALYAGEGVGTLSALAPVAEIVRELASPFAPLAPTRRKRGSLEAPA